MAKISFSKTIRKWDASIIKCFKHIYIDFARIAIFVVYFWFGLLKAIDISPASPIVQALFDHTMGPFVSYGVFYSFFAIFEMTIGILFLIKGAERLALFLLALHLITTVLPLFLVPEATWQSIMIPTLEGQYIIKNILIIASAITIGASLKQTKKTKAQ
ncbi:MAG: hypothetical protein Q8O83_01435 [bacterium]|nr:hypothetical protein [bacterium]